MQTKYIHFITLVLAITTTSLHSVGNLVKISNNTASNYTLSAHENKNKKLSTPIISQGVWTGNLSLNNAIHLTSQQKTPIFVIEAKPTHISIGTFDSPNAEKPYKIKDIRINYQDILNNSQALIHRAFPQKSHAGASRTEKSQWSLSLKINQNNQIEVTSFNFDASTEIPGQLIQSYVVQVQE